MEITISESIKLLHLSIKVTRLYFFSVGGNELTIFPFEEIEFLDFLIDETEFLVFSIKQY